MAIGRNDRRPEGVDTSFRASSRSGKTKDYVLGGLAIAAVSAAIGVGATLYVQGRDGKAVKVTPQTAQTALSAQVEDAVNKAIVQAYGALPTDDPEFTRRVQEFEAQNKGWAEMIPYKNTILEVRKLEDKNSAKGYRMVYLIAGEDVNGDGIPDDNVLADARSITDIVINTSIEATSGIGGVGKQRVRVKEHVGPQTYGFSAMSAPKLTASPLQPVNKAANGVYQGKPHGALPRSNLRAK